MLVVYLFVGGGSSLAIKRGVTELKAKGGYSNQDRIMLMTIIDLRRYNKVINICKEVDPNSFVFVTQVSEVSGFGFNKT